MTYRPKSLLETQTQSRTGYIPTGHSGPHLSIHPKSVNENELMTQGLLLLPPGYLLTKTSGFSRAQRLSTTTFTHSNNDERLVGDNDNTVPRSLTGLLPLSASWVL